MSDIPSTKPYLIRAIFDWCVDKGFTPHIMVAVDEHARVPMAFVREGRIVLNIAPYATHQLAIGDDEITCQARFGGVAQSLLVPIANVMAVYARENGQGMAFEVGADARDGGVQIQAESPGPAADDEAMGEPDSTLPAASPVAVSDEPKPPTRSHLRVIK
jgi:stringent starvation protein B